MLFATLLVACAAALSWQSMPVEVSPSAADRPLYGGAVFRPAPGAPQNLDPASADSLIQREAVSLCCLRLLSLEADGTFSGEAAESWAWSPDGMKLTLMLRADLKDGTGRAMTAQVVSASFERLLRVNPEAPAAQ